MEGKRPVKKIEEKLAGKAEKKDTILMNNEC